MYKALALAVALLTLPTAHAQGRLLLDEADARKNLLKAPAPVLPAGTHLTGKVVLLVQIAPDGHVLSATPDTGNSKLREPAADAVKQWRFKPFTLHNDKVAASTKLTVEFGPESAAAPRAVEKTFPPPPQPAATVDPSKPFHSLEDQCRTLVATGTDADQQAHICSQAAELADLLQGDDTYVPRRAAYVYAATALMRIDNLKAAQAYGTKAIAVVKEGHDDDSGTSAAYAVRGQARSFAGDLHGADLDLTQAEAAERKAIATHPEESSYKAALKNLLLFHAKLLVALKHPDQATIKTTEAATL